MYEYLRETTKPGNVELLVYDRSDSVLVRCAYGHPDEAESSTTIEHCLSRYPEVASDFRLGRVLSPCFVTSDKAHRNQPKESNEGKTAPYKQKEKTIMSEERRAPISNTRGSGNPREGSSNRNNNRGGNRNGNGNNRNRRGNNQGGGARQGGRRLDPDREVTRTRKKPAPLTLWQKFLSLLGLYKPAGAKPAGASRQGGNAGRDGNRQGGQRNQSERGRGRPEQGRDREQSPRRQSQQSEGGEARKREPRKLAPSDPSKVEGTRLYIGNLSYETTEYELEELLKGVGKTRNIEVVYNRRTHKSKGYAFVEMQNVDEAKRAVEVLHDQPFMGRQMIVNGAKSKGAYESDESSSESAPAAEPKAVKETTVPLVPREPVAQADATNEEE